MSNAISTQGVYIGTSDGASPESFGELAEVKSIGGPNETSEELDVTHLRSPGAYKEYIQSFKDGGELPITMNFVSGSTSQLALMADYEATPQTVRRRQITYPDGSSCVFSSFVKARNTPVAVGAVLELQVTLRISGAVIWTYATVSPSLP